MIKKIVYHSGVQVLGQGIGLGLSLLATSILTRRLGAVGYGQYLFVLTFANLLVALANWGSQIIGVRELARAKEKGVIFGSLVVLRLLLGLITLFLGLIAINYLPLFRDIVSPALLSLILVWAIIIETSWEIVFQAFLRMDLKVLAEILSTLLFLFTTVFLLNSGLGVIAPIMGWIGAKIFINCLLSFIGKRILHQKITVRKATIQRLFRESLPMGTLLVLSTLYDRAIDSLVIKHFLGSPQVGLYGLAYKIYGHLVLPAYFLTNTIFPILSKKKHFWSIFSLGGLLLALGLVFLIPLTFLLSQPMILLIGGKEFFLSIRVLRILILGLIFAYFNHLVGFSLIALNRQTDWLKIGLLALIWNLILNLIFIPQRGIIAAAWITVSTEALVSLLALILLLKGNFDHFGSFLAKKIGPFANHLDDEL